MITTPDVALEDARALVDAASAFVRLTAARRETEARVVLLARRLTQDWRLTDEEAVAKGGEIALARLAAGRGAAHGR